MKRKIGKIATAVATGMLCVLLGAFAQRCGEPHELGPLAFGPQSSQGAMLSTSLSGVIDPTQPRGWAGTTGLVACPSSCSNGLALANSAAVAAAAAYASSHNRAVYVPPGRYPIQRVVGQSYAVDLGGDNNLTVIAYGAIFMLNGDQTSSPTDMFWLRNASHVKIIGATFSARDATNTTTSTNLFKIGDGGSTSVDDVQLLDSVFTDGKGGDCLLMDGGTASVSVKRVTVTRNTHFEGANTAAACQQSAIHIKPGVQQVTVSHDWFLNNAARDIWVDSPADGPIGRLVILNNTFERSTSASTLTSVELAGFGGTNDGESITFKYNKIVGGILKGSNLARAHIIANPDIELDQSGSASALIDLSGRLTDVWVEDNYLRRGVNATNGPGIKIASDGVNAPAGVWVTGNRVKQYSGAAAGIHLVGAQRARVRDNDVTYHSSTADSGATGFVGVLCSSDAVGSCSGTIARNSIKRDDQDIRASLDLSTKTTHVNTVVEATQPGQYGNNITVRFVADSGVKAGSRTESGQAVTIHYKTASSQVSDVETLVNASPQIRVKTPGTASNTLTDPADTFTATNLAGAVAAGRMLAGVELLKGASNVGGFQIRDNKIDGAASAYYSDANGSTDWPEGFPVISGNATLNCAAQFAGGIATWVPESTPMAETISTGAADPTKAMTYITTANTVAYTQADGVTNGWNHCYKIKSVSGTPNGTMTPAHFADGTTHTISWTAAGGSWCMSWDTTSTTYRLGPGATGVTIN